MHNVLHFTLWHIFINFSSNSFFEIAAKLFLRDMQEAGDASA